MHRLLTALCLLAALPGRAAAEEGHDFIEEARALYRIVACAGDGPLPAGIDEKVVRTHCRLLTPALETYQKKYGEEAKAFIAGLRPPGLPNRVVYPFGGGDLLSALTTYPEAKEITTLSLEHAGDPRRIREISRPKLEASLALIRSTINGLLLHDDSRTDNLMKGQRGELPGQLSFFLVALAIHGFEPVALHYVRLEPDGSLQALSEADIAALEKKNASLLKRGWVSPDFSEAFSNAELIFAPKKDPTERRVHRHFAADLGDAALSKDPAVLAHLGAKGPVVAMTKAASYLLWRNDFSKIRDYLLGHMVFMISDSTGIPPSYARKAGFEQITYGHFDGSFLAASDEHNKDFRELWKSEPERKLPFRYGYIDSAKHNHLLITQRAPGEADEHPR